MLVKEVTMDYFSVAQKPYWYGTHLVVVDGQGSGVRGEDVGGSSPQVELVLLGGEADLSVDGGLESNSQTIIESVSKSRPLTIEPNSLFNVKYSYK